MESLLVLLVCGLTLPNQLDLSWVPQAPVLEFHESRIIEVSSVDELFNAVGAVKPGESIVLGDGIYYLPRYLEITTDRVVLRSASRDRNAVILDGSKSQHGELIGFRSCTGVTVADLTIQNIKWNGFKINSDDNVQQLTIYNCVIHNIWERGVKSVRVPEIDRERIRPKKVKIQYCLFYNDRPKQFSDDDKDTPDTFDGNYIGGIDTMFAKEWTISDNVFVGIQGRTREGRGCVFMWHHAEDCVIERNVIIDCDVGIALGNSSGIGDGQSSIHATNLIVRNNFVVRTPESGIVADYTHNCQLINNTIYDPTNRMNRLIRIVHANRGLMVSNNLLSGPGMSNETDDEVQFMNNMIGNYTKYFVNPNQGNLHLLSNWSELVDSGVSLPSLTDDIDRQPRDHAVDIGADEWIEPSTADHLHEK